MEIITEQVAGRMIRQESGGRLFGVTFRKADGNVRRLVGRRGVQLGVKGTGNPEPVGIVRVHEFVTRAETVRDGKGLYAGDGNATTQWRSFRLDRLEKLRMGGKEYQVA